MRDRELTTGERIDDCRRRLRDIIKREDGEAAAGVSHEERATLSADEQAALLVLVLRGGEVETCEGDLMSPARPGKPGPKPKADSLTDAPVVTLRIRRSLLRSVDAVARRQGRTRADMIRAALSLAVALDQAGAGFNEAILGGAVLISPPVS